MRAAARVAASAVLCLFVAIPASLAASNPYWREPTLLSKKRKQRRVPESFQLFAKLFEEANPAIVNISTLQLAIGSNTTILPNDANGWEEQQPLRRFFQYAPEPKRKNLGSGIIIRDDGYIVTNYHVVRHERGIAVVLADGRLFSGTVAGKDPLIDVALIKIDAKQPLPTLTLGDSTEAKVGDWVLAIGNPFGFHNTMTHGIISAVGRVISPDERRKRFDNFIQIDASINPGNSGGPLINLRGEVIGLNTAITAQGAGIAFAVPINTVKAVLEDLYTYGYVLRGWLGIVARELGDDRGLEVMELAATSPAKRGGVKKGDRLTHYNGQAVNTLERLSELISNSPPGSEAKLQIFRRNKKRTLKLIVGDLQKDALNP